jgi:hypothetical protein
VGIGVRGRGRTGVRGLCWVGPVGGDGLRLHERNKNICPLCGQVICSLGACLGSCWPEWIVVRLWETRVGAGGFDRGASRP